MRDNDSILDGYIEPRELARQLKVSLRTIHRYEERGTGPPVTLFGRRRLYKISSAKEWLDKREKRPAASRAARGHANQRRQATQ